MEVQKLWYVSYKNHALQRNIYANITYKRFQWSVTKSLDINLRNSTDDLRMTKPILRMYQELQFSGIHSNL